MVQRTKKILCLIFVLLIFSAETALCAVCAMSAPVPNNPGYVLRIGSNLTATSQILPFTHPNLFGSNASTLLFTAPQPTVLTLQSTYYCQINFSSTTELIFTANNLEFLNQDGIYVVDEVISDGYNHTLNIIYTPSTVWRFQMRIGVRGTNGYVTWESYTITDDGFGGVVPEWTQLQPTYNSLYYNTKDLTSGANKYLPSSYSWASSGQGTEFSKTIFYRNKGLFLAVTTTDNYSFLSANTVINGQCSVIVSRPNNNADDPLQFAQVWLTNGVDPYRSDFQYFVVDDSYELVDSFFNQKYSATSSISTYQFYFTMPDTLSLSFAPTNIMVYFDSTYTYYNPDAVDLLGKLVRNPADDNNAWFQIVQFDVFFCARRNSSVPVPDSPVITPDVESDQQQASDYQLSEEYRLAQNQYNGDELTSSAQTAFNLSGFASTMSTLYNSLNYQGTDFHFYFHGSGNVPILNVELWQTQEIPVKTYIDALPNAVLVIFRLIVWFTVAVVVIASVRSILNAINMGDDK